MSDITITIEEQTVEVVEVAEQGPAGPAGPAGGGSSLPIVDAGTFGALSENDAVANGVAVQSAVDSLAGPGMVTVAPGVAYSDVVLPADVMLFDLDRGQIILNAIEFGKGNFPAHLTFRGAVANQASRVYIVPNGSPVGTRGALKVFGTDYEADPVNYVDLGIYYDATKGRFYINNKANGSVPNSPVAFSFQDGAAIAGEFFPLDATAAAFSFGGSKPAGTLYATIGAYFVKDALFENGKMVRWRSADGLSAGYGLKVNTANVLQVYHAGLVVAEFDETGLVGGGAAPASSAHVCVAGISSPTGTDDQVIPNATVTQVNIGAASVDEGGMFDAANHRVVIQRTGVYEVHGLVVYTFPMTAAADRIMARLYKNGTVVVMSDEGHVANTSQVPRANCAYSLPLVAGDTIHMSTYQNSGAAEGINGLYSFLSVKEIL